MTFGNLKVELYRWNHWKRAVPVVDQLLALSTSRAAIRTRQAFTGDSRSLGFGRMIWSEKNNQKWTEKYRTDESNSRTLRFFRTEVWAPDWNTVWKENRAPDIFIKVGAIESPTIRQWLLVAIREPTYSNQFQLVNPLIGELALLFPNGSHFSGKLRWAEEAHESGGYTNGLSDQNVLSLCSKLVKIAA